MKKILFLVFIISAVAFVTDCGIERWKIKILADKESTQIKWQPITSSIKQLTQLVQQFPVKNKKFDRSVRYGYEFNVYQITCKIREFRKEDDGDYHLVLVDVNDSTKTMVGEIVDPNCSGMDTSNFLSSFKIVRGQFEKFKLPKNKVADGTYTITGVCFFDKVHGQLGVAPNGVEIHPIMDIEKNFK